MRPIRWGIIGCGDVTEVKSGPGFQKAEGSALVAVMRRDAARARDYARRHGVPRAYDNAADLLGDGEVDAVYIATPPASHCELALMTAAAGKPCLVEKPMARTYAECQRINEAFDRRGVPVWVAYYRRALPRFLMVREALLAGEIGRVTSVHVEVSAPLLSAVDAGWRVDPASSGGGLFFDLASHCFDLLDFVIGPISDVTGFAVNTGGRYAAEDVTAATFEFEAGCVGTGIWNFNAPQKSDVMTFLGTEGSLQTPIFSDTDVVLSRGAERRVFEVRNPPHVHQPLIQNIVDELRGQGRCEATGDSAARTSRVLERCVEGYYARTRISGATP
jgi:1,5-anhydro-D-fructose reductase (1,5-anhydro-D-mannitol-forming)